MRLVRFREILNSHPEALSQTTAIDFGWHLIFRFWLLYNLAPPKNILWQVQELAMSTVDPGALTF